MKSLYPQKEEKEDYIFNKEIDELIIRIFVKAFIIITFVIMMKMLQWSIIVTP